MWPQIEAQGTIDTLAEIKGRMKAGVKIAGGIDGKAPKLDIIFGGVAKGTGAHYSGQASRAGFVRIKGAKRGEPQFELGQLPTVHEIHIKRSYKNKAWGTNTLDETWAKSGTTVPATYVKPNGLTATTDLPELSAPGLRGTVWHEFGHAIDYANSPTFNRADLGYSGWIKRAVTKGGKDGDRIFRGVSVYGNSDLMKPKIHGSATQVGTAKENWCEAFSAVATNSPRAAFVHPDLRALIDTIIEPEGKK